MTKEEFRKHCEDQIARCIKLKDYKHLKEHELSLALLNECEQRKQNQENLIKYIEDKIIKVRESTCDSKDLDDIKLFNYMSDLILSIYTDLLERIKNATTNKNV